MINMPDISMCKNKFCDRSNDCYRFTARPNPYMQSYISFSDDEEEIKFAHDCNMFWLNRRVD